MNIDTTPSAGDSISQQASRSSGLRRFSFYIRKNWLPIFSAFVLGLGFPLWRLYFFEVADVRVEVTEVDRRSDPVRIELARDPIFKALIERRPALVSALFAGTTAQTTTARQLELDELERLIESQTDDLEPIEKRLIDSKKTLEELNSRQPFELSTAQRLNRPLAPEERFDSAIFNPRDEAAIADLRRRFIDRVNRDVATQEVQLADKRRSLDAARTNLAKRREQAELRDARIYIKCAVSNSGAGSISLKPQGFLRVYLGGNNYIDIELTMELYDEKGDLQPRGSRIITFRSDPLAKLREAELDKINTYFKQNVPAVLFMIDINENVYSSNTVPFAKGLYQQTVFDTLRSEASKRRTPDVR